VTDKEIESRQDIPGWAAWPVLAAGVICTGLGVALIWLPLWYLGGALIGGGCAGIAMRRMIRGLYADRKETMQ